MSSRTSFSCTLTLIVASTACLSAASPARPLTLVERTAAQSAVPAANGSPMPESGWSRIYIDDGYVREAVVRSLGGAAEWLEAARCQTLLSEFTDLRGRPLKERLAELDVTLAGYLRIVVFEDGERHRPCAPPGVLAFTAPNSRVVRVCGRAFATAWKREPEEGRAAIIHEVLHSLGLGENPPAPRDITHRVKELCW